LETTTEQIMAGMNLQPTGKPNFLSSTMEKETTGLPKRPFEQLAARVQEVQREITQKAYDVAYRELMRREKPLYKNELALETERAREDLEKRPDILAYQAMVNLPKDNEFSIKLDRNEVDGLYNRESPADYAAFQKGTRASESFPNKMFAKDGLHPDEAAGLVGFSSGKEMLDQLRSYESAIRDSGLSERKYLDGLVKAEGERRMAEKDNLNERVSAEAIDLALSVKQVDVLIAEMHALVPGEETKLTRGAVEEAAERNFGQLNSKKVKTADFERQVAKWGREAFRFSNADKPVEALKALQKQLSNFLMAREAKAFEKERDKAEKIMGRFQANRSLENVTQEYTDYAHSILARMDRSIPVDIRDLEDRLANKSFLQFVSDERNKGLDIADTSWLHDPTGLPRFDDLNVEQYRQLADTFESLYNKGKEQKIIEIGDKQLERDIVKERLIRYLKGMTYDRGRVIDGKATGAWNNLKWVGREIDAIAKEPQYIVKRIDNDDPLGPWSQDIYRPIYDQLNARDDRLRDVGERFAELYDDEWARASENLVTNSFRDLNNKPMQITNAQKLVMLLNSGNDRNMRLLAHTLSEDVDTVREWLKQNVTEKDLKIAHGVLDLFENLWPDLKDMTRRVSGVSPAKVRARGYDTPVGRFEGGYFPSLADPDMVDLKGESDLFDRRWFDPATDSRAAHERTGALYALSFDLNRLPYVVRQTVHDIYMRESVSNAWSFMNDRDIKSAFTDAWGSEYTKQLKPWLSHVANDGGVPTFDGLWVPYKWSREARRNAVAVLVGGRPSTALIHGGSALAQSVTEVGIRPFVKEAWNVMTRSEEAGTTAWNNSMGLSSALRNRMHNIYTSLESEVPHILNQSNARQEYLAFSTRLIAALDQWSAVVVFRARMKQALDAGMSTDEAIWTANRSVDIAHGSNTLVNRPAVMRGGEGSKWFTQFMGFFNNTYNRGRDIGVKISQEKYMEAMIGTLGFLAASAAVHTAVRYNQKDPVWKQALESGADVTVGGIPIVRDAFRGMIHGGDYGESMMTTMTKGITQPVAEWGKFATGGKAPKDWVSHLLMAPGFGMGFLPGVTGMGPKFLTGHAGDWLTLATTKTGSGHAQYLWDSLYRHSLEPPDIRRGILEGNWHQRKAGH
jgi:predicted RNA-binding protein Jag